MTTRYNICHILASLNGASFMGIDFETVPKLTGGQKNDLQGKVTKRTEGASVMVFANKYVNGYEEMVKRRLVQEGKDAANFVLGPRTWGTRIDGMPLVEHKGEIYLDAIFMKSGESTYLVNGAVRDPATITGLSDSADAGEQGGLDNKVIIRTIALGNVTSIRSGKNTYVGEFYYDPNEPIPAAAPPSSDVDDILDIIGEVTTTLQSGGQLTHADIDKLNKMADEVQNFTMDWLVKRV